MESCLYTRCLPFHVVCVRQGLCMLSWGGGCCGGAGLGQLVKVYGILFSHPLLFMSSPCCLPPRALSPCPFARNFRFVSLLFHLLAWLHSLLGQSGKRKETDTKLLPTLQDDGFSLPILLLQREPFLSRSSNLIQLNTNAAFSNHNHQACPRMTFIMGPECFPSSL